MAPAFVGAVSDEVARPYPRNQGFLVRVPLTGRDNCKRGPKFLLFGLAFPSLLRDNPAMRSGGGRTVGQASQVFLGHQVLWIPVQAATKGLLRFGRSAQLGQGHPAIEISLRDALSPSRRDFKVRHGFLVPSLIQEKGAEVKVHASGARRSIQRQPEDLLGANEVTCRGQSHSKVVRVIGGEVFRPNDFRVLQARFHLEWQERPAALQQFEDLSSSLGAYGHMIRRHQSIKAGLGVSQEQERASKSSAIPVPGLEDSSYHAVEDSYRPVGDSFSVGQEKRHAGHPLITRDIATPVPRHARKMSRRRDGRGHISLTHNDSIDVPVAQAR